MYNYANAQIGNSALIEYFYSFAALEGLISNWAEGSGYSDLWGPAVTTQEEQITLHHNLRSNFNNFINEQNIDGEKLLQLQLWRSI